MFETGGRIARYQKESAGIADGCRASDRSKSGIEEYFLVEILSILVQVRSDASIESFLQLVTLLCRTPRTQLSYGEEEVRAPLLGFDWN